MKKYNLHVEHLLKPQVLASIALTVCSMSVYQPSPLFLKLCKFLKK